MNVIDEDGYTAAYHENPDDAHFSLDPVSWDAIHQHKCISLRFYENADSWS